MASEKVKGYLFALLTACCWAISPIFIHLGLQGLPSSIWGTVVGLAVSTLIYLTWYLCRKKWKELKSTAKIGFRWQLIGGFTNGVGILFRNVALDTTQVAVVVALAQSAALFTVILSPLLMGAEFKERITKKLVLGILAIVAGSLLTIIGRYS